MIQHRCNKLAGRLEERAPDNQGALQLIDEESQCSRRGTLKASKQVRGHVSWLESSSNSLHLSSRTIWEQALVGSQSPRQAR